jgi:hypothetical protein
VSCPTYASPTPNTIFSDRSSSHDLCIGPMTPGLVAIEIMICAGCSSNSVKSPSSSAHCRSSYSFRKFRVPCHARALTFFVVEPTSVVDGGARPHFVDSHVVAVSVAKYSPSWRLGVCYIGRSTIACTVFQHAYYVLCSMSNSKFTLTFKMHYWFTKIRCISTSQWCSSM